MPSVFQRAVATVPTLADPVIGPDHSVVARHSSPALPWLLIATLTAILTAVSTYQSLLRYQELRSGWSWDLAYYNQWFWALTRVTEH